MFTAIVLRVRAERSGRLPDHLGRAVYAEILKRLATVDAELAATVHDTNTTTPLTCSGLLDHPGGYIRPESTHAVRVTGLSAQVSAALHECLLHAPPARLTLHGMPFAVDAAICDPKLHRWSASISLHELASRHTVSRANPRPRLSFQFLSPTAFRFSRISVPVPMPDLFFGSLADRWNALSPIKVEETFRDAARTGIAISDLELRSLPVLVKGKALHIGSVGTITYRALKLDRYQLGLMHLLADFSFYSGVGIKTSIGMGQVQQRP